MRNFLINFFGYFGMICVFVAYFFLIFGIFDVKNFWFLILNFGSAGVGIHAFFRKSFPAAILEFLWFFSSFFIFCQNFIF